MARAIVRRQTSGGSKLKYSLVEDLFITKVWNDHSASEISNLMTEAGFDRSEGSIQYRMGSRALGSGKPWEKLHPEAATDAKFDEADKKANELVHKVCGKDYVIEGEVKAAK